MPTLPVPITTLPTPPSTDDPTDFDARADTFLSDVADPFVGQTNAVADNVYANALDAASSAADAAAAAAALAAILGYSATSSTSLTIGTGSKSFTIETDKSFFAPQIVIIADAALPTNNHMIGTITSYNPSTGAMVVNVTSVGGSGTKTSWVITLSGTATVFSAQPLNDNLTAISAIGAASAGNGRFIYVNPSGNAVSLMLDLTYNAINFNVDPALGAAANTVAINRLPAQFTTLTATGAVAVAAGSVSAPSIQFGGFTDGFYSGGSGSINCNVNFSLLKTGAGVALSATGEGLTYLALGRYESAVGGPNIYLQHARGTIASVSSVSANDELGSINFRGQGGASMRTGAQILAIALEAGGTTAMGTRMTLLVSAIGSVSPTEMVRLETATGLSMFGANPVIDADRGFVLRSYTLGTLPAASGKALTAFSVSDLGGGISEVRSDGTNWKRVSRGGQETINSNAAFSLIPLTNAEEQKHTGTLTADRALTLSTTGAYAGARFRLTRTGGGAFNITHALKNLATNTWAEFIYDGSAWYLAAYGAL